MDFDQIRLCNNCNWTFVTPICPKCGSDNFYHISYISKEIRELIDKKIKEAKDANMR